MTTSTVLGVLSVRLGQWARIMSQGCSRGARRPGACGRGGEEPISSCGSKRSTSSMEAVSLVIKQGGLVFPLLPSSRHRSKTINTLMQMWMECLFKAVNKANITKSRGCAMNFEFADELLHRVVTLADSG